MTLCLNELVSESSGFLRHDLPSRCAEARVMSLRANARLALRKGRIKPTQG
jgi:hypothetical protein